MSSNVYIISALNVFYWNRDEYLINQHNIDETKANLMKPIKLLSNGKIVEGWETFKYVYESNTLTNLYYQLVEKDF